MRLSSYLNTDFIFLETDGITKEEMIAEMVEKISAKDRVINEKKTEVIEALLKREGEISTFFDTGVIIPHTRLDFYDDFVLAAGINKNIIDGITPFGEKGTIEMIYMIIGGKDKGKLMLGIMNTILKMSKCSGILGDLRKMKKGEEVIGKIAETELEVSDNVEAEDIVNIHITPIHIGEKIENAVSRMKREGRTTLPVTGEGGRFEGEISAIDIIKAGLPGYASFMADLNFVKDDEVFNEMLKNEREKKIGDIFTADVVKVDKKTSLVELSFLIGTKKTERIYVVENERLIGEISSADILNKVFFI